MNEYDEINTNIENINLNEEDDEKINNQSFGNKNNVFDSYSSNKIKNSLKSKNGDSYELLELDSDEEEEIKEDIKITKDNNFNNIMKNLTLDINNFKKKNRNI